MDAEKLRELKKLLDEGIITQEEFDKKKGEFLSTSKSTEQAPIYITKLSRKERKLHAKEQKQRIRAARQEELRKIRNEVREKDPKNYKRANKGCLIGIIIFCLLIFGMIQAIKQASVISNNEKPSELESVTDIKPMFDAKKYNGMDSEKLKSELGSPESTDSFNWTNNATGEEFHINSMIYSKENAKYEFWIYNSKVVRIRIDFSEPQSIDTKQPLELIGLNSSDYKIDKSPAALVMESYNDNNIPWIKYFGENLNDNKINLIQIVFDETIAR